MNRFSDRGSIPLASTTREPDEPERFIWLWSYLFQAANEEARIFVAVRAAEKQNGMDYVVLACDISGL